MLNSDCFSPPSPPLRLNPAPSFTAPPGFRQSAWFGEQVREQWVARGVRVVGQRRREQFDPKRPTRLVIYATPNGNTIEQTLGCATADGLDWHFDIQHVAAQVRKLRERLAEREHRPRVRRGRRAELAGVEAEVHGRPGARPQGRRDAPRLAARRQRARSRSPGTAAAGASCSASSTAATRSPTRSSASSSSTPTTATATPTSTATNCSRG